MSARSLQVKPVQCLKDDVHQLKDDVAWLKGGYFETRWQKDATAYLGSRGYRRIRLVPQTDLVDLLDDPLDDGRLAEQSVGDDILLLDAVHRGRRRSDDTEVHVASEITARVHPDDVNRAAKRASALAGVTGGQVIACVAGASLDERAESAAVSAGVVIVIPTDWPRRRQEP